jgi:hypothetical protein
MDLKHKKKQPYGLLELITPENAASEIIRYTNLPPNHNRVFRIKGERVSAKLATQLLTFK